MATAAIGLYNKNIKPYGGAALHPPWEGGGRGKYAGQPIIVMGGSSSLGQHGATLSLKTTDEPLTKALP